MSIDESIGRSFGMSDSTTISQFTNQLISQSYLSAIMQFIKYSLSCANVQLRIWTYHGKWNRIWQTCFCWGLPRWCSNRCCGRHRHIGTRWRFASWHCTYRRWTCIYIENVCNLCKFVYLKIKQLWQAQHLAASVFKMCLCLLQLTEYLYINFILNMP